MESHAAPECLISHIFLEFGVKIIKTNLTKLKDLLILIELINNYTKNREEMDMIWTLWSEYRSKKARVFFC